MNTADQHLRLVNIFYPYLVRKQADIRGRNGRFVHYTSAEVAVSIIRNREVWMRKSRTMNDFSEIEYGNQCMHAAYHGDPGTKFKDAVEGLYPGFCKELGALLDRLLPAFKEDTYLTCMSEHLDSEDEIGRLSMWRAYGGDTGVALVLKNTAFFSISDALKAYTSPVAYLSIEEFKREFQQIADQIEAHSDFLRSVSRQDLLKYVYGMFRFAILATKHPGFREEREWRIIHSPSLDPSRRLIADLQIVRGIPQPIMKIPLVDVPDEGLVGAEINSLLDRIIVGPTQYPGPMREAFVRLLEAADVTDARSRVYVSHIPLRR